MFHPVVSDIAGFFPKAALLAMAFVILGISATLAEEAPPQSQPLQACIDGIFKKSRPAVVRVRACDALGIRFGSGFFIDPAGTIYTHTRVVAKAHEVRVIFNDRSISATVLAADERSGIAVLKTDFTSPFLPIGVSKNIKSGTPVVSIGYPQEFDASASLGTIADRETQHPGGFFPTSHFRANLAAHCGQGGSPVLGFDGKVIGIVVSQIGGGASCHVLPIEAAEKVRSDIVRFGELRPGWVGVEVEQSKDAVMGSTACISKIASSMPESRHNLREGDTILRIGAQSVRSPEDILDASFFLTAGESTEIDVVRDGAPLTFSVKPMLHPSARNSELHATQTEADIPALH